MIATHAAVALDNMRRTVRERAVKRRIVNGTRAAELALIDSIHRGIAASGLQAIAGWYDKLREVFHTGDASIHCRSGSAGQRLHNTSMACA
jgi:hypothetical protein